MYLLWKHPQNHNGLSKVLFSLTLFQLHDDCAMVLLTLALSFQNTAAETSSISNENFTLSHKSSLETEAAAVRPWVVTSESEIAHIQFSRSEGNQYGYGVSIIGSCTVNLQEIETWKSLRQSNLGFRMCVSQTRHKHDYFFSLENIFRSWWNLIQFWPSGNALIVWLPSVK